MLRLFTTLAVTLTVISAIGLYWMSYATRSLDATIQNDAAKLEQLKMDIAVLKSERAHLLNPARLEPLARADGMVPLREDQVMPVEMLPFVLGVPKP